MKKPTADDIRHYLARRNPLGLRGATVEEVPAQHHLIYRVAKDGRVYAFRMVNPASYRRGEWISMREEDAILRAIKVSGLGPRPYFLDERHEPPLLIQEFVEATCFNALKPLSREHLVGAAEAIAELNGLPITAEKMPFLANYARRGYRGSFPSWCFRLADAFRRAPRCDVARWAFRILPIAVRVGRMLSVEEWRLPETYSFHFDGAHTGNTYWRDGRVVFLDWQKISLRNDPSFTLVRFMTSVESAGDVSPEVWDTLINAYCSVRYVPDFADLACLRLLERETADLVWVLWDHARRGDPRPVEEGTSVAKRYRTVRSLVDFEGG